MQLDLHLEKFQEIFLLLYSRATTTTWISCVFALLCSLHFCLLMCFVIKFAIPKLVLCRACLGMLFCNYPENKLNLNAIYKNEGSFGFENVGHVCIILINILYYTNSIVQTESASICKSLHSRKCICNLRRMLDP